MAAAMRRYKGTDPAFVLRNWPIFLLLVAAAAIWSELAR
jgi:hypothetical protein